MLKGIVNFLFGNRKQDNDCSFTKRLNKINADLDYPLSDIPIPEKFCDSIYKQFMDNPIVYDIAGNAMDYSQLDKQCKKNDKGNYLNPYTNYATEIILITDDFSMPDEERNDTAYQTVKEKQSELKVQIETFISTQEKIYLLYKLKKKLEAKKSLDRLKLSLIRTDIAKELNYFMTLVSTIIWNQEGISYKLNQAEEIEVLKKPKMFLEEIEKEKSEEAMFKHRTELNQIITETIIKTENAKALSSSKEAEEDPSPNKKKADGVETILLKTAKTQAFASMSVFKNQDERKEVTQKLSKHFNPIPMQEFPIQEKLRKGMR